MDYNYLASVLADDNHANQLGVQYLAPTTINGLNAPVFINSAFDKLTKTQTLRITRDTTPHTAWYKVITRDDRTGNLSEPSIDQQIGLTPNPYDLKYRLEVSRDEQATWAHITDFAGEEVELTAVADITNAGHSPLTVQVTRLTPESAEIVLQNPWYKWELNTRPAHYYRIREEDGTGEISPFTVLPRGGVNYKPLALKMRRKEANGTPATFDGLDSLDIWFLDEDAVDITQPTISFVDDHLVAGKEYSYTFFIDDEEGFRSEPFVALTTT